MKKPLREDAEYVVGIDEAGRGPLAGPVAVGICLIPKKESTLIFKELKKNKLNDSKQIKEVDREKLFILLSELKDQKKINWVITMISAKIIPTKGISFAINSAISKSIKKLDLTEKESSICLEMDGALKVPQGEWKKTEVIIKGDSIRPSIMIASILAKVTRDRYMKKISKKIPEYGFEIHKGYGTQKHRDLIKKHGLSTEHRVGWCKIL